VYASLSRLTIRLAVPRAASRIRWLALDELIEVPITMPSARQLRRRKAPRLLFACGLLAAVSALGLLRPAPAFANVASVSVSTSANPTQGVPVTVGVSGSSQLARDLYAYVDVADSSCPSLPGQVHLAGGAVLANATAIGPGSFSQTYSYTPPSANQRYLVCAYVDDSISDPPDAENSAAFTTVLPAASVSVSTSANPTQGVPVTVGVSGSSQLARDLYAYVDVADSSCPSLPDMVHGNGGAVLANARKRRDKPAWRRR
jgi:hypothetical protein